MQSPESWMMMAVICATLFQICQALESLSKTDHDKIISLSGQPDVSFQQFAGYVTVDEKQHRALCYYFVEPDTNTASKPLVLWLNGAPALFLASACLTLGKKQRKRSLNIVLAATLILVFLLSIQPLNAHRIPEEEKEEQKMLVSESSNNRPVIIYPSPNSHGCGYVSCSPPSKKPVEQKNFAAHPTAPHAPSHVKVPFGSATNGK